MTEKDVRIFFGMITSLVLAVNICLGQGLAFAAVGSEELVKAGYKRYGIESGIVEYTLSGTQKGTVTLYFDRWGWREAKYTDAEINMMGYVQKVRELTIMDGEEFYTIDLEGRNGTRFESTMLKSLAEKSSEKDLFKSVEYWMKKMGGEKIGQENIAGKECDIWEIGGLGGKSWLWKSITMKTHLDIPGMEMISEATSIQENKAIPSEKFKIPSDIELTGSVNENPGDR